LFVLTYEDDSLTLLVDPDLRLVVTEDDHAYLDSLLPDLVERSKQQPLDLFKQLCSLGIGPLVTVEAGERIADHPPLLDLCSRFEQL